MRKSLALACVLALMIFGMTACQSGSKTDSSTSIEEDSATPAPSVQSKTAETAEVQYQYRAVCIQKEAHGGNNQILTRWLDSKERAEAYGQYHGDHKYKGHRWIIEERVKPQ